MKIGDRVRITTDIPPILRRGDLGKVRERWLKPQDKLPGCWVVDFQNGTRSHFIYEDEMELLELRVAG